MWKQKIFPNLDDKKLVVYYQGKPLLDWFLWCLAVAQKTFNVAPFTNSAQNAWNNNITKHLDRNLPEGCFVPIWWTGGYKNYGHVAVAKRTSSHIQIWSSPYSHKPFFDYFEGELNATIDNVSRIYGTVYAGWTEAMNTTRVIEWVQDKTNEEIAAEVWLNLWGKGQDRINRLTNAGYDWRAIQALVDKGIGKPAPEPKIEELKKLESVPETPKESSKEELNNENASSAPDNEQPQDNQTLSKNKQESKKELVGAKDEVAPTIKNEEYLENKEEKMENNKKTLTDEEIAKINEEYMKLANGSAEMVAEASNGFDFNMKQKMIAYIAGDLLLLASAVTPQVILLIMSCKDNNLPAFGTALSSILATIGSQILLVFKLLKKKK